VYKWMYVCMYVCMYVFMYAHEKRNASVNETYIYRVTGQTEKKKNATHESID